MNELTERLSGAKTPDAMRDALVRAYKIPSMFDYLKDWPGVCFPSMDQLRQTGFLDLPYMRMVRVCSSKMVGDLWELAIPSNEARFEEFCMTAPGRLAKQLDRMFKPEHREHVRVMRQEMYPQVDGFNFSAMFTTVCYYDGDNAEWQSPKPPVKDTHTFSIGCEPPMISL